MIGKHSSNNDLYICSEKYSIFNPPDKLSKRMKEKEQKKETKK